MSKKLLSEAQIRRFAKLASLPAINERWGSKKGEYKRRDKDGKVGHRAGDVGGGKYGKGGHYKAYMDEGTPDVGDAETIEDDEAGTTGELKRGLKEDSGARDTWDQWKHEQADDDHIMEIENHLRALKDDRDYERHEAEYDHDKYEDEGEPMEEMESRATNREIAGKGPDARLKPSLGEAQIRKLVRKRLQAMMENKKGGSNK